MRTEQKQWDAAEGGHPPAPYVLGEAAQLVLLFGDTGLLCDEAICRGVREAYPNAVIAGCSTAGEILGARVRDGTLAMTAVAFDRTKVSLAGTAIGDGACFRHTLVCRHGGAGEGRVAALGSFPAELAVLVSCVGRKLVLKQRIEEEAEAVRGILGPQAALTGFNSYGELCPEGGVRTCELHNQTMTITTFAEA